MALTEKRSFCEEIEIAVFSGAELTEEQLNHIENCESCRTLLSQMTDLRKDLSSLSVTGIEDGKIADAVMESIKKEKVSVPFPKFKITHHLGTAAAVVIILVAALMIKNPSQPESFDTANDKSTAPTVFNSGESNHILSNTADVITAESEAADEGTELQEETALYSDDGETPQNQDEQPKLLLKSASPKRAEAESMNAAVDSVTQDEDYFADGYDINFTANEPLRSTVTNDIPQTEESVKEEFSFLLSDSEVDESVPEEKHDAVSEEKVSSAGGGASSPPLAKPESNKSEYIFSGIDFSDGEENFDYNISLANARLYELYGDGYALSRQKLSELGVDNAKLLELAPTVTEEMFDFYKVILDVFE